MIQNSTNEFSKRHIGPSSIETEQMLAKTGVSSISQLIDEVVPSSILSRGKMELPDPMNEFEYLQHIKSIGEQNSEFKTYIGQGYYGTITPSVILRNVFENPGWYTQYTPYQAEISQGRMESLLNFQTMVSDLTGLEIANASLLDEGTAAAEAMSMMYQIVNKRRKKKPANKFFVDRNVYDQTIAVIHTRSEPIDIEIVIGNWKDFIPSDEYFGTLLQYPDSQGNIEDYEKFCDSCRKYNLLVCAAVDLLSLTLLKPPGEWGADVAVGNSQRFGVPLGYGGPHAAFFATKEDYKRLIPGRIIGYSEDVHGNKALRMALQTREQHIRREKATSNICTAQALLANMAAMYAVYHGSEGLTNIAMAIQSNTSLLHTGLSKIGYKLINSFFFDTVSIAIESDQQENIRLAFIEQGINLFYKNNEVRISLDETTTAENVSIILQIFTDLDLGGSPTAEAHSIPSKLKRTSTFLQQSVFNTHHTETEMMRYLKILENKDLSLVHSMIPLGSCTMKLNAATEMIPVSWSNFANLHPFIPIDQAKGYQKITNSLSEYLCSITGFTACSLQPNSGAQGEYAGLITIRKYHLNNQEENRNIALIPSSAHGTNPASAVMAGMKVIIVDCDEMGNIDIDDLKKKTAQHGQNIAVLMITYPSTHGVFETGIKDICNTIHEVGGMIYMDGANMNAQLGLTSPGLIGADVCHLNLHKTFAIPHGGGGPGMGPICCNEKLAPFLPGHQYDDNNTNGYSVSAAPWASASILLISYGFIRMLGNKGLTNCSEYAILNANYLKSKLDKTFDILYTNESNRAAHEFIIDLRKYKSIGVSAEDIAKRFIDYGFHAPTLSFPVPGTIMIEPTESENKEELDRFCDALLQIKIEIDEIATGTFDPLNNVLVNAPHTLSLLTSDEWDLPYTRSKAAYPLPYLRMNEKFWASVSRVDNAKGDRNLICVCPPIETYMED